MFGTTIQAISIYKLRVPLREPFVISLGPLRAVENIVVVLRTAGGLVGYGALAGIAWGYRAWRGREGMGGGDPKLMGAIGLWLGWRLLPAVLVIASLIGLGLALLGAVTGRGVGRDTAFPFGALLGLAAFAGWIAMIASGL